jgi:hypothetical protein
MGAVVAAYYLPMLQEGMRGATALAQIGKAGRLIAVGGGLLTAFSMYWLRSKAVALWSG